MSNLVEREARDKKQSNYIFRFFSRRTGFIHRYSHGLPMYSNGSIKRDSGVGVATLNLGPHPGHRCQEAGPGRCFAMALSDHSQSDIISTKPVTWSDTLDLNLQVSVSVSETLDTDGQSTLTESHTLEQPHTRSGSSCTPTWWTSR